MAQLIFERYLHDAELVEVNSLEETSRGFSGFGSTKGYIDLTETKENEPLDLTIIDRNATCDCHSTTKN
jgi:hypothetical protein